MRTRSIAQKDLPADALCLDVREPGEFAGERLPGSVNVPLSRLEAEAARLDRAKPVVVLCASGTRARKAAETLVSLGFSDVSVLEGGLSGCRGLEKGPGGAWDMFRQVRLAAGGLVLLGAGIGFFVSPWGYALCAAIGAGLVYSALSDSCGMVFVLAKMPWNAR